MSKLRKLLWNIEKRIDSNTRKAVCYPELLGVYMYCRTSKYSSNIESDVVILLSSDFYLKTLTRPSKYSICACMFYLGTGRKPLFYMKNQIKKNSKATWGDDIKFVKKSFQDQIVAHNLLRKYAYQPKINVKVFPRHILLFM